jgi:hypothetical protein
VAPEAFRDVVKEEYLSYVPFEKAVQTGKSPILWQKHYILRGFEW